MHAPLPTALCPLCGGAIKPVILTIQSETHIVAANGRAVVMTPSMSIIVERLNRHAPMPVNISALISAIWGIREEPDTADNIICVYICRIRKLLKPLGYDIQTLRSSYGINERAYSLVPSREDSLEPCLT